MSKLYNVGTYIRLSRDSAAYREAESMSIENQQAMLSKFIDMMPGWIEKRTYIDDGVSGGDFNRQGFQDMMTDVRLGTINLVLVQDLSRFGRNYLEAGKYLEEELPSLGCRFVALSDGIDTENGENDIMPFLNAMNDYFLRNLSDRITSVLKAKAHDGQKLSGGVPYGYMRNPEEHTRLIIDTYAADVVRHIFEMRASGMGYTSIVGALNRDGILPPKRYYLMQINREVTEKSRYSDVWALSTVKRLLENESYIGHTISFKRKNKAFRGGGAKKRDESEWIRVENTHAPIIGQELWYKVRQVGNAAKAKAANQRVPRPSLFSGLIVCADCQSSMMYYLDKQTFPSGKKKEYGAYCCKTHAKSGRAACSWHRISELALKKLVLSNIKQQAEHIRLDEVAMAKALQEKLVGLNKAEQRDITKERKELKRQYQLIEACIEHLYEEKVSGNISATDFTAKANEADVKLAEISDRLSQLDHAAEQTQTKHHDIERWIALVKEKSTPNEVDRDLLECLIDKIEVGEKYVVGGVKTQDIKVFHKFVGLC